MECRLFAFQAVPRRWAPKFVARRCSALEEIQQQPFVCLLLCCEVDTDSDGREASEGRSSVRSLRQKALGSCVAGDTTQHMSRQSFRIPWATKRPHFVASGSLQFLGSLLLRMPRSRRASADPRGSGPLDPDTGFCRMLQLSTSA